MELEKKKRLGAGRVAFLARKEAIKAKIDAGHTMITVYEEHQKQLGIGYGQFVNYVNKFIRDKSNAESKGSKQDAAAVKSKTSEPGEQEKQKLEYSHDAASGIKRNDLI